MNSNYSIEKLHGQCQGNRIKVMYFVFLKVSNMLCFAFFAASQYHALILRGCYLYYFPNNSYEYVIHK